MYVIPKQTLKGSCENDAIFQAGVNKNYGIVTRLIKEGCLRRGGNPLKSGLDELMLNILTPVEMPGYIYSSSFIKKLRQDRFDLEDFIEQSENKELRLTIKNLITNLDKKRECVIPFTQMLDLDHQNSFISKAINLSKNNDKVIIFAPGDRPAKLCKVYDLLFSCLAVSERPFLRLIRSLQHSPSVSFYLMQFGFILGYWVLCINLI